MPGTRWPHRTPSHVPIFPASLSPFSSPSAGSGLSDTSFPTTPSNDFSRLRNLEALDLSNNFFFSSIPQFLFDLPLLKSL
ncbi:unnamed protein product [Closterium sp. NIES-54]